jgi:hypothetical protein
VYRQYILHFNRQKIQLLSLYVIQVGSLYGDHRDSPVVLLQINPLDDQPPSRSKFHPKNPVVSHLVYHLDSRHFNQQSNRLVTPLINHFVRQHQIQQYSRL